MSEGELATPSPLARPLISQTGDTNMAATATLTPSTAVVPTTSAAAALTLANVLYEKKGAIRLRDGQSAKGAQRPELADMEGSDRLP